MPVEIAIIAAMEREVRPLVRRWRRRQLVSGEKTFSAFGNDKALVVCSGIGGGLARQAAVAVFASERPRIMISAGLAGALSSQWKVAQIFKAATVVDLGTGARYEGGGSDGVLVSASSVLDRDAKRRMAGAFGADAVDMEAAAIALVAEQHNCPFIAVKAISDQAEFAMPSFEGFIDSRGCIRTASFAASCALRPSTWPPLARLARNTARASQELCRALSHLIEQQQTASLPSLSEKMS